MKSDPLLIIAYQAEEIEKLMDRVQALEATIRLMEKQFNEVIYVRTAHDKNEQG